MNSIINLFHENKTNLPDKTIRVLGIDLGTTNSTVAELIWTKGNQEAHAECIEIKQETLQGDFIDVMVPSVVALFQDKTFIGEGAKRLGAATQYKLKPYKSIFSECKNDMGVQKKFPQAPEGYKSPLEISAIILGFLREASQRHNQNRAEHTIVTVPASFQTTQREDTLKAAENAGIKIEDGDLLDEPVAAFLCYAIEQRGMLELEEGKEKKLLVFDFGGGTCDVAIFALCKHASRLNLSPLSVSRYHRLGGGDIDRAILYEILLPQILVQNDLTKFDLDFEDKKLILEPAFIGLAESLKIGLCKQINKLKAFKKYSDLDSIKQIYPGFQVCTLGNNQQIKVQSPSISAAEFERVLEPFLNDDLLFATETEYRLTNSIFSPIQDAIDRADLKAEQIDLCLLVGGSTLIPQVRERMDEFFTNSKLLIFDDYEATQTAIAKGSAYHALALSVFGHGIVQPVAHDSIGINTDTGIIELVHKGQLLPYSSEKQSKEIRLDVPRTLIVGYLPIRIEIIAGSDEKARTIETRCWNIEAPVNKGDAIWLECCLDANQTFKFSLSLEDGRSLMETVIENPLTHVVNPHVKKIQALEIERKMTSGQIQKTDMPEEFVQLARLYSSLRQTEKAIACLKKALQILGEPDAEILNLMGLYYADLGNDEKAQKMYLEATKCCENWSGPWFNLSLLFERKGDILQALAAIENAIKVQEIGPNYTQKAMLEGKLDLTDKKLESLENAFEYFDDITSQSDWELGWYIAANKMAGNDEIVKLAEESRVERSRGKPIQVKGDLPNSARGGVEALR